MGVQVLLVQYIVDGAIAYIKFAAKLDGVIISGVILVVVMSLESTLQRLGLYQMGYTMTILTEKMTPDIVRHMEGLAYEMFEEKGVQEIFKKMTDTPEAPIGNCYMQIMMTIQSLVALIFSMAVIFSVSPWIGLGVLVIGIPMMALGYYAAGCQVRVTEELADTRRRLDDLKSLLTDKHAMYEMKLFGAEILLTEKWNYYSTKQADITMGENRKVMTVDVGSRILNVLYLLFVIGTAAAGLLGGNMTPGQFAGVLNCVRGVGGMLNSCSTFMLRMLGSAMEISFLEEFLHLKTRMDSGNIQALSYYDIAFENVSFRYPGTKRDVLKNVTFYVKEGERIAFVGENGAGKSTIIKLLCGLYEPDTGSVTVGGVAQFKFMDGLMRLAMRIALCVGVAMVVGRYSPILIFAGLMELIPDITTKIYFEKKVAVFNRSQRIVDRRCGYFLRLFTRKESVKEMRVMGFDKYMEDKWTEENAHKLKRLRVINMDICRKQVLGIFSINACYALNIGVAFYLMIGGLISLGAFAACFSAFSTWHSNLMMVVAELADVAKKYYVNEEYYDYFSVPTEKNGLVMYQPFRDRIVAEQVYFWYDGSESPAISGLNCEIKKGEHVVIVGENGSGKTTFSKLLTGAYLPSKGRINYDGQKTEDLNRNSLYDHISVVSQDFVRYHFTLRENVGIGNLNRMEDTKAMEALLCQIAGKELIDKTGGLDVQLGREFGGKELSGGEWQKVAIARGLWKDSDMIILDEPTSALDPLTEYDILSKFLEMIRGRTSVIISHRVGICRTADKIIVMKGGRMLECGRHQELLQAGGEYAKIWQEQAKWYL